MADKPASEKVDAEFGAQQYLLLCLLALVVVSVVLGGRSVDHFSIVPFAAGAICLLLRWISGPPIVLLTVSCLLALETGRLERRNAASRFPFAMLVQQDPASPANFILCAAVVAFVVGFYRYVSLTSSVFPLESRKGPPLRPGGKPVPIPAVKRGLALATRAELLALVSTLPAWCALGYLLWHWLATPPPNLPISTERGEWGLILLLWSLGVGTAVITALSGYLDRAGAPYGPSLVFLQDVCWRETRREQSRLNRWIVWARLRAARRKERS